MFRSLRLTKALKQIKALISTILLSLHWKLKILLKNKIEDFKNKIIRHSRSIVMCSR